MMPGKDGIETLKELRAQDDNPNRKTFSVCLTANAISGAREEYIRAGFDDYLTKPIDAGKLEDMLLKYLPKEKIRETQPDDPAAEIQSDIPEDIPEEYSMLDGELIDVRKGIENSGGREMYRSVLAVFYESAEENTEEICRLYEEKDYKNYTIKVHALKSSARIIGAVNFGEEAQKLEDAGKSGDVDYIREHQEAFIKDYGILHDLLKPVLEAEDEDDRAEADEDLMKDVYEEIRSAAETMDYSRLENVFEEMKEYRIPESRREHYEKLKKAAEEIDYDKIRELMAETA